MESNKNIHTRESAKLKIIKTNCGRIGSSLDLSATDAGIQGVINNRLIWEVQ